VHLLAWPGALLTNLDRDQMPSIFETISQRAMGAIQRPLGESATFTHVATGTSLTVTVVFNEFVGAIDDRRRAIFTVATADFATSPDRGDYFVLSGATDRWTVLDVRDDQAGGMELRCDGTLGRL
jgi:hypothetical protein